VGETDMRKINVLNYPVFLGDSSWNEFDVFLEPSLSSGQVFILTDFNTRELCLPVLTKHIPRLADRPVFSILPGEDSKDISTLEEVWHWLMDSGAIKSSLIVNLGGGVVSDLGGFAAATFKRGMNYVNLPTSMIGQVDASIGGKTGINISHVKNQAGVFYDPLAVFIIPEFLKSLPGEHLRSGMAEIIKSAILAGGNAWEMLKKHVLSGSDHFNDLICETVNFKCRVVADDPYDLSSRQILNFGHTIGHGLESFFNRHHHVPWLHGEAVAAGMICEAFLSHEMIGLQEKELNEIAGIIKSFFSLKPLDRKSYGEVWNLMDLDKKRTVDGLTFSLIKETGMPVTGISSDRKDIYRSFDHYNMMIQK
jgi:3-dehydroquinate synthase